jgi:hypothetical protein
MCVVDENDDYLFTCVCVSVWWVVGNVGYCCGIQVEQEVVCRARHTRHTNTYNVGWQTLAPKANRCFDTDQDECDSARGWDESRTHRPVAEKNVRTPSWVKRVYDLHVVRSKTDDRASAVVTNT